MVEVATRAADGKPPAGTRLMNPAARRKVVAQPLAPRLASLAGKTIGLLDNTKHNADLLLQTVGELLVAQHGVKAVIYRRKISSSPGAGPLIGELAGACDAVVNAYGDCGSCTSWCIHDSVELEAHGVPTATVNSDEFVVLGQAEAVALDLPGLPIVTVPHPMGDASAEEVRRRAERMMAQVLHVLTTEAGALEEEYLGKFAIDSDRLRDRALSCPI
jgi:hypothetical protein